jgi:ABC-type Fe3+/spermidine/putrescine transport system ATPase subunit
VRVQTAHGVDLWVPRADGAVAGARLWVMLRPERVRLGAAGGANVFPATVTEVAYLGGLTSYRLRVGSGEVFAHAQNAGGRALARGEVVSVAWDEQDCVSLVAQ